MAESNLAQVGYITESTWGTTPATPELTEIRLTSDNFAHNKNTVTSNELRSDRMRADLAQVGSGATGGFNYELSYASFDPFFESAFYGAQTTLSETGSWTITEATEVLSGSATDFDNVLVGGWIKVAGAANSNNNGIKRVIAKAGDGSSITCVAGSFDTDETASITLSGTDIRNGVTEKPFSIERRIDVNGTDYFQVFRGMVASSMSMNIATQQIATGSFGFVGSLGAAGASTIDNSGTYTTSNANPVMNGTANVSSIFFDDYNATTPTTTAMTEKVRSFGLNVNNNIRGLDALGETGNFDLGAGAFTVEGTMEMYYTDNSFFTDFIAHTYKSFSLQVTDTDGNIYVITLPRVNFSEANPNLEGIDTDIIQPVTFTAIRDSLSGTAAIINGFPA